MSSYPEMDQEPDPYRRKNGKTVTQEIEDNLREKLGDNFYEVLTHEVHQREMRNMQVEDNPLYP